MDTIGIQAASKAAVSPKAELVSVVSVDSEVKEKTDVAGGKVLPLTKESVDSQTLNEGLKAQVNELNRIVQNIQRGIQFSVDEESGNAVITITDKETGDEIRKFPSDQVLAISAHIAETLAVPEEVSRGVLMNIRA